jgi:hypothetical protein
VEALTAYARLQSCLKLYRLSFETCAYSFRRDRTGA